MSGRRQLPAGLVNVEGSRPIYQLGSLSRMGIHTDALASTRNLASDPERFPEEVITVSTPELDRSGPRRWRQSRPREVAQSDPGHRASVDAGWYLNRGSHGGHGPPIVLLHGPGEFALTWLRVMPELAKANRLIVPDLPGHGASLLGDAPLDSDRMLAWLGELIDQTWPSPPFLAGHLLGGAVAARFAVAHGELLRGLPW
jgi:Alpha/beta hydrolase family